MGTPKGAIPWNAGIAEYREEVKRLKLLNADLLEALQPFATAALYAETDENDHYGLEGSSARYELTLGNLRKARAAIAKATGNHGEKT